MIFFILTISLIGQSNTSKELISEKNSSTENFRITHEDSLAKSYSIEGLYRLDSLSLLKGNFKESEIFQYKLIEVVRKNSNYINSSLANKYLKSGIEDLKKRRTERGKRKIIFASKLDPSNRHIPLTMLKLSFPNIIKTSKYLWGYIQSIQFLNNKVFLIKILLLLLIIFASWILLSTLSASVIFFISYITKWLQNTINISGLWIGAILFSMFVWLPIQFVFLILVAISLLKINKANLIRCATLLILLPLLISYSYIISGNFNPGSSIYKEFKTRFNPYSYKIDSPLTPYGYSVKGINEAIGKNFTEAKDFFEEGYNIRRDVNYLENLGSVYYAEGDTTRAINMCENIISNYPQNEIANITIIKILYEQLNFDKAAAHMRKTGFRLTGMSDLEPPFYSYPPERWLYKYIFVPRGLFKQLAGNNLYLMIIIGICLAIMATFKKEEEKYCPICKGFMLTRQSKERMCLSCIKKLSLTKSKSIRERLKRRIISKAFKVDKITNILMNLIIPGSAHFYKKRYLEGIIISFFAAALFLIFLYSILFQVEESLQYRTYIGNNFFLIAIILFYSLSTFSSWRLESHGNGR